MLRVRLLGLVVALISVSTAAYAFQEQQAVSPRTQETSPQLTAPLSPDATPGARGTPVRIPGLGTLGVIPKMDFGLDLLYGAAESSKRTDPTKSEQDDVLVGGRIKHKF
jgi:hypothetical protein